LIVGTLFITSINPVTSILIKKYEIIKGSYEKDKDYLAAITRNGIWIKEKENKKNNFIKSTHLKDNNLMNVTIYEFDIDNNFIRRIEAKSADISLFSWSLKDAKIIDGNGKVQSDKVDNLKYNSLYDINIIKTLYSNLKTVSFWDITNEIKLLEKRGYSTRQMETKLHTSIAFPFFLLAMILLSGVFTLSSNLEESNFKYVFITIAACVLIYFFNDFSAALGETEKLSVTAAVWMPIIIIFIFGSAGVLYANQK